MPLSALIAVWVLSLAAGFALWVHMTTYEDALKGAAGDSPVAADGIVGLELAFTADRAGQLLGRWAAAESPVCPPEAGGATPLLSCAKASVRVDFAFIAAYVLLGASFLVLLLRGLDVPIGGFWALVTGLPLLAGLLDVGENLLLLDLLGAAEPAGWMALSAGLLAVAKFYLLFAMVPVAAGVVIALRVFSKAAGMPASWPEHLIRLPAVLEHERIYLRSRRQKAEVPWEDDQAPVGLALSGGGIRSATLCLGVLQRMTRSACFRHVDYLSTVSGGGYLGTALSSLLSFKATDSYPGPDAPEQFRFKPGDEPHFSVAAPEEGPLWDEQRAPSAPHRRWLSGRMVVLHLRAFGEYLVRRPRVLDRDVLRAVGTVLSGILSTLSLFALLLFLAAVVALVGVAITGAEPLPALDCGVLQYLETLMKEAGGGAGLGWAAALGVLFALGAGATCGLSAARCPRGWFRRAGDTVEDARQRRELWVLGVLTVPAAFASPALLGSLLPGVANGLLLSVAFLLGGLFGAALGYVLLVALAPGNPELRSDRDSRSYVGAVVGLFLYLLIAAVVLVALTALLGLLTGGARDLEAGDALTGGGSAALLGALISGVVAWWRGREKGAEGSIEEVVGWVRKSADFVQKLVLGAAVSVVIVAGLAFMMVLVEQILRWAGVADPGIWDYLLVGLFGGALLLGLGFLIDFNKLSLHYFYRDRLVEAFMGTVVRAEGGGPGASAELRRDHGQMRLLDLHGRLGASAHGTASGGSAKAAGGGVAGTTFTQYRVRSGLLDRLLFLKGALKPEPEPFSGAATAAPYHLYNACLNLATDRDSAYRTRKSDIFLFSKLYCGAQATGYIDTGVYRSGATKVARAMTISGAAADSALGRQTFFAQSFGATLFNIRLGQWLENPAYRAGRHAARRETWVFWPKYFLMEILGMSDTRRRLVRLSDGGHTGDNLGLIALLQRRCRLILAVDAECDTEYGFLSLMYAIQYADVDLGIRIDIRLDDLRPDEEGRVRRHYAIGTIVYPETDDLPRACGHLVVLKASVHKDDDEPVLKYRASHPVFPQETTVDQFFSEEQFEAYRKLGENLAGQLLDAHPELETGRLDSPRLPEHCGPEG